MNVYAIVVAAGEGRRMGGGVKKPYIKLCGYPVLLYALKKLILHPLINGVIVVVEQCMIEYCQNEVIKSYLGNIEQVDKIKAVVSGGIRRQDSVYNGLKAIPEDVELVMIHDGVRPFISDRMIEETIKMMKDSKYDGVIVGVKVKDTIKVTNKDDSNVIDKTLDRDRLWSIQTPQVFKYNILRRCYDKWNKEEIYATDDACMVELAGGKIRIINGEYENIKITTPFDLSVAEVIIKKINRAQ
jgi:2-C-methyl-D-erythritol 4-phosphate cytidylyltransferase